MDADGEPHLTDFGLARLLKRQSGVTQTTAVMGTPSYMAPEQASGMGKQLTTATDTYALGAAFYQLLTGRPPFAGASATETLRQVIEAEPKRPRLLNPAVDADLETICLKCLAKIPSARYASAAAVAEELERWRAGRPILARPAGPAEKAWRWCRRNPVVASLSVIVLLLLVVVAIGSSVAAFHFQRASVQIQKANDDAKEKLWMSHLGEARARRHTGQAGQRLASLELVCKAAALRSDFALRNEAIACLAVADLCPAKQAGFRSPRTEQHWRMDPDLQRYAVEADLGGLRSQGAITVRALADDKEVALLPAPNWTVWGIGDFSPDGRYLTASYTTPLVAASLDLSKPLNLGTVRLWDIQQQLAVLDVNKWVNLGAAFSPDSKLLALGKPEGGISIYTLEAPFSARQIEDDGRFKMLAFDPKRTRLACVREAAKVLEIRALEAGQLLGSLIVPAKISSLAWSPDGQWLVAGCVDSRIYIWEAESAQLRRVLEGHSGAVAGVGFNHAQSLLASSSLDGTIKLWSALSWRHLVSIPGGGGLSHQIQFSPDDSHLALYQEGPDTAGALKVVESREYKRLSIGVDDDKLAAPPAFSPDGNLIGAATDKEILFWDARSGKRIGAVPLTNLCDSLIFHPDSRRLITCESNAVYSRTLARVEGAAAYTLSGPRLLYKSGLLQGASLSWDGRFLAIARPIGERKGEGADGLVFDLENLSSPTVLPKHLHMDRLAISPDGRWAAGCSSHNSSPQVKVWDASTAECVATLPIAARARAAFSPDGRWLATWSTDYQLWSAGSWRKQGRALPGHFVAQFNYLAFSPDKHTMAILKPGIGIQLLDTSNRVLANLDAPEPSQLTHLTFSADGSQLAALETGPYLQLWDLRLIRHQLRKMDLDWDLPTPPHAPESAPSGVPSLTVLPSGDQPAAKE